MIYLYPLITQINADKNMTSIDAYFRIFHL